MAAGDYIYYAGTSGTPLTISNSSTNAYAISNKNPASPVTIDFGTKATTQTTAWGAPTSANYVHFNFTGTSSFYGFYLTTSSNIYIYGGEVTSTHGGVLVKDSHNCWLLDQVVHDVGGTGISLFPSQSNVIHDCTVRGEVYNFSMNPSLDPHKDKGTGLHACNAWDGVSSSFYNNTIAIYGHDSLKPGTVSYGKTWPEGGGGSCIEFGQADTGGTCSNNTFYAKAENLLMIPNGTNPGSTGVQTGGNVINAWGAHPANGTVYQWIEGTNCTGAVFDGDRTSGGFASVPITVNHGRAVNVNQYTGGGNISVPYETITNVTYHDCTVGNAGFSDSPSGTISLSGSAVASWSNSVSASGTVQVTGASFESFSSVTAYNDQAFGTISLSDGGSVEQFVRLFSDTATGTISLTGLSVESIDNPPGSSYDDPEVGTLFLGGDAVVAEGIYGDVATGTLIATGSSVDVLNATISYGDSANGNFTLGGDAQEQHRKHALALSLTPVSYDPSTLVMDPAVDIATAQPLDLTAAPVTILVLSPDTF